MQKLNEISKINNKGITLIALIITVIVMLILVGVTINVVLNGGLFVKAKKATYQTEISVIKEQLEVAKVIKISENKGNVPSDYGITIETLDISNDLKNKYKDKLVILADGVLYYDPTVVTDEKEQGWLEEMGIYRYELPSEDELGDLNNYLTTAGITFENCVNLAGQEVESDLLKHPIYFFEYGMDYTDKTTANLYQYISYNNKIFKIIFMDISNVYTDVHYMWNLADENREHEGKYVSYDSNDDGIEENWIVLYNENSKIQLLNTEVKTYDLSNYTTGEDLDGNGTIDNTEKTVHFYNNIIEILNDYATNQITETTFKESVRCLGTNPANPYEDNAEYWASYNVWDLPQAKQGSDYPNYLFTIKKGDTNYEKDHKKVICLNLSSATSFIYISRLSDDAYQTGALTPWIGLHTPQMIFGGWSPVINHCGTGLTSQGTFGFYPSAVDEVNYYPVVTLKPEIKIDTSSGDGSLSSPYKLIE